MMENRSGWGAAMGCAGMAVVYVGVLYSPTLILRRNPPSTFNQYMIRRFICAIFSTLICLFLSSLLLVFPTPTWDLTYLFGAYGLRTDHFWPSVFYPFSLTCLMYGGSFVLTSLVFFDSWSRPFSPHIHAFFVSFTCDITAWRNLIVG